MHTRLRTWYQQSEVVLLVALGAVGTLASIALGIWWQGWGVVGANLISEAAGVLVGGFVVGVVLQVVQRRSESARWGAVRVGVLREIQHELLACVQRLLEDRVDQVPTTDLTFESPSAFPGSSVSGLSDLSSKALAMADAVDAWTNDYMSARAGRLMTDLSDLHARVSRITDALIPRAMDLDPDPLIARALLQFESDIAARESFGGDAMRRNLANDLRSVGALADVVKSVLRSERS